MQDARTTTAIRHAVVAVVLILKRTPVNRDESMDEVKPAKGILGST